MATQIVVPTLGESVTEATVGKWLKAVGDSVAVDDPLVEIETDKVTLEVNAPAGGTLAEIVAQEGAEVAVGARLGTIAEGAAAAKAKPAVAPPEAEAEPAPPEPAAAIPPSLSPAVRKLVEDNRLDAAAIPASG